VDVTCFSCHDVGTLQELFLSVDTEEIDEELATMLKYAKTTCLSCHGSYAELIKLTADLELEEWYYLNPHETPESITYNHTANISCNYCHKAHEDSNDFDEFDYCADCHNSSS
jgi:mono/diheme cytochrome c family protein